MTDKKFTDEEIKSSLEVIATTGNCNECKIRNCKWGTCNCSQITANAALDLINRQKAEIERLKSMNQAKLDCIHDLQNENEILSRNADTAFQDGLNERRDLFAPEIKAEAYKEFAEKAKENFQNIEYSADTDRKTVWVLHSVAAETLDNLLKEMIGEKNA